MRFHREMYSKFYVDSVEKPPILSKNEGMETEVRTLKQELVRTQEALRTATKKCRDLVKELDNRTAGHESEKSLRDQQLSRILRALLVLEARLKQEQKSIRQLLCEKDNVIRNQQLEIARLRRYTKNYIKCKREQTLGKPSMKVEATANFENDDSQASKIGMDSRPDCGISKDIENLKCEIITKLSRSEVPVALDGLDRGVKKTHSFAGSDISKTSLTSSENTDVSIITTTTEGSPSLLSTEGFCEGESTDVSPGSTLNTRCTPTMITDSENETTMIYDDDDDEDTMIMENGCKLSRKKASIGRSKIHKAYKAPEVIEPTNIARTESKDDGMDCNFVSEDEEKEQEPIYVNACNETNSRNLEHSEDAVTEIPRANEDYSNNNNGANAGNNNNNNNCVPLKMKLEEQTVEETSGNWYSDPDEDKISDDVFRHSTYRPNSNHNSVLECVNQILLRDMEEEENTLSVPRSFKYQGRIVQFQSTKLSDIESVGSEMERKNSEEGIIEKESPSNEFTCDVPASSFEPTATEDAFGMSLTQTASTSSVSTTMTNHEPSLGGEPEESKAIPIVIIEPKVEVEETRHTTLTSSQVTQKTKVSANASNAPLKLERIEEKTCLQMSTKGLTIAKNLDYEDIESLPEIMSPPPKTPPALPPKPQFKNNTLILKKIPSPSFLIDETRKKQQLLESGSSEHSKKIFGFISFPLKSPGINVTSARSLNFDEAINKVATNSDEGNFWRNRFNNVRSSFQTRQNHPEAGGEQSQKIPRVTNIVRHFEEFKIGGESKDQPRERARTKDRHVLAEFDQQFDIRQNFEEFNLDECDLSDDPDRPEGDGSERLGNLGTTVVQNEKIAATKDNNNVPLAASNSSTGYDHFLEATGLSNKSILTPSRLLSNHKSMLKPKDVKYKNKIKANAVMEKHGVTATNNTTHVRHWTGPFV
ncbi:uncharacterized protein LOC143426265 isoform X2 [Xylocopa sonorina]|uniref:uncharacterized protein LOC143426265 isoform X2 n=1 Tax=Xylocopa sonorina TaxID=1818115 RepID=UPI00403B01BE